MNYSLTYGRNSQMIWALILPAFIALLPLMIALELTNKYFPENDWLYILITILYVLVVLASTFILIKSIQKDVIVSLKNDEIHIKFQKKNFFHPSDIYLPLNQISNTNIQTDKGYDFLYIETNQSQVKNFYLRADESDVELLNLNLTINRSIEKLNQNGEIITRLSHISIFKQWPMKALGMIILIVWISFPVYMFYNKLNPFNSSKYLFLLVSGAPIVYKVFIQQKSIK
jgi:hypothetical protein